MIDFKALAAQAATMSDQTQDNTPQFDDIPPAGFTVGRLIEYIEFGKQKQKPYKGKEKPPALVARIVFELLGPKNLTEYQDEAGNKQIRSQTLALTLAVKTSDKAKYKKLFMKMRRGRADIKHMAQMLGEAFVLQIFHNVKESEGKKFTYVNLDENGEYGIGAPVKNDPLTGESEVLNVKPNIREMRLFLFEIPTKETWASLFIEGTKERKNEDGSVTNVSKNWLQERILSATNFSGSALEAMLADLGDLPVVEPSSDTDGYVEAEDEDEDETPTAKKPEPGQPKEKPKAAPKADPADALSDSDKALAALGL
ncbi:hypothetical protein [Pannonibacter sp. SL95]|uniref:hypothetical protein n=1 Tax=Pannonibacter sp. SL95 TaxID=2995153 RepID=UPI002273CB8F|nr:hypothetical protein [Pannonibacter sp. SL95]MCY1708371.1 hypothetical protein [Pannonibacter sp. SL95]